MLVGSWQTNIQGALAPNPYVPRTNNWKMVDISHRVTPNIFEVQPLFYVGNKTGINDRDGDAVRRTAVIEKISGCRT